MNKLRVFIETTIFNRYFEDGREYCAESKALFDGIALGEIEAFTSVAVLEELEKTNGPKREQMLALISSYKITALEVDTSAYDLADVYVEMGIIPARFRLDGLHMAVAAINDMDCIISLNFHHINKLKTKTATEIVNRLKGYNNPYICTPAEVIYDDE